MGTTEDVKVLLVDDEKNYLTDFLTLFSKKFSLSAATNVAEALAVLKKEPHHVVVTDQRMPYVTGSELLSKVAELYPRTIRILLTGYADIEAVIEAVNKGEIYRYVSKDTPLKEIELVIRQAIDKYRLEESNRELLLAKKRLIRSLVVRENLSMVGAFGQEVHHKMESLIVNLFNYVFQMGKKELNEKAFLNEFHKMQGAMSRLRELSSFSERLKDLSSGTQQGGINQIIEEMAGRAAEAMKKEPGGQINVSLDSALPTIAVQRYSFMRVLKELLENAILFSSKEGKKIDVRSRLVPGGMDGLIEEEPAVVIEIGNNGPGIPRTSLSKVFAPFYTTFSVSSEESLPPSPDEFNLTDHHHYGFGLPISQWIVSVRHNGTIDLTSDPEKGTKAIVTIPVG